MDKDELKNIQLAIHDLITKEAYDEALPLIYTVLEIYPNNNKLVLNEYEITTTIVDCELDDYECTFMADGFIQINTKDYTHITLNIDKLKRLISLIKQAEMMYNKLNNR